MAVRLVDYDARWLPELIPMWRASFEQALGLVDPHPLADQERYFLDAVLPHHAVWLALAGDDLAGFIAASHDHVDQLYVRPGRQGQGIGTLLLARAQERSGGSLTLFTFARNLPARRFYEKHGFHAIAQGFEPHWQLADVQYRWTRRQSATPAPGAV